MLQQWRCPSSSAVFGLPFSSWLTLLLCLGTLVAALLVLAIAFVIVPVIGLVIILTFVIALLLNIASLLCLSLSLCLSLLSPLCVVPSQVTTSVAVGGGGFRVADSVV